MMGTVLGTAPATRTEATPRAPIGRTRILFQILLYVALTAHVAAWYALEWRQVGTLAPTSLFYFLQTGLVNAGVLLVCAALVSVFLLGNAFCGWACHFGILQDFAAGLLRRVGLRPLGWNVPFRLRALLLLKLLLVNTVLVWFLLGTLPAFFLHCGAPEPLFAIGTWVTVALDVSLLGFLLTYLFGSRAFCRLLCPVILLTRLGNLVAPMRMRRRRACNGCGACDRACPMGNRVSGEILDPGSVSSLDCIRCGRCRDACPVGAIAFAAGDRTRTRATRAGGRRPGTVVVAVAGILAIVFYEVLFQLKAAGILNAALIDHLPNWEFFYVALGLVAAAAFHRTMRKGVRTCADSS